ncbi:Uncharacterized protein dnm_076170 [Desulfonema magnum]|uniref:Uncharacterized protein n=1 Tax=Desulfonema magnum TaxID=45655 RepID=A0A975BU47_9BACT|nr:Uncharacterized protein dnm_076170 [Desulfonema magnum]
MIKFFSVIPAFAGFGVNSDIGELSRVVERNDKLLSKLAQKI